MANQYKNKVVYYGETLIDISEDTVRADKLYQGYTAHDKSGAPIVGTMIPSGGTINLQEKTVIPTQSQQIILPDNGDAKVRVAENLSGTVTVQNSSSISKTLDVLVNESKTYARINGSIQILSRSSVAAQYQELIITFNNAVLTYSEFSLIDSYFFYNAPGVTITGDAGLINALRNSYTALMRSQRTGEVSFGVSFDEQPEETVMNYSGITIDFCNDTQFLDGSYDALSKVTVEPIPSNYIDVATCITYRIGTSAPDASIGSNGDIYLQTSE